jgi:hypothetical protein
MKNSNTPLSTCSETENRFDAWIDKKQEEGHFDMKLYLKTCGASSEAVEGAMEEIMSLVALAENDIVAEYPKW